MRSSLIDRRLMYLEQLFVDLKEIQTDINAASDPALVYEYEQDKEVLFNDLEDHAQDALFLLESYFQDCKEHNLPIVLEYYKIFKELDHVRRFKLLHLD